MLSNKFNVDAPTYNELKRLSRITADGYRFAGFQHCGST
jgi:hypothetical protein